MEWQFEGEVMAGDTPMWKWEIPVPQDISAQILGKNVSRLEAHFADRLVKHCSLLSKKGVGYFLLINQEELKKLELSEGSALSVKLKPDSTPYGRPMPEELKEALAQDPEADHHFHSLTPGKMRSLMYIVEKAKRPDTRITKSLIILEYLKERQGQLDFKELHEAFKTSRFRR